MRVSISARIIRWPQLCCCCLGVSNEVYCANYNRFDGSKSVRVTSRSWNVPYCTQCIEHVNAKKSNMFNMSKSVSFILIGVLLGLAVAIVGGCCFTPIATVVVMPKKKQQNKDGDLAGMITMYGGIMVSAMAGATVMIAFVMMSKKKQEEDIRNRRRHERYIDSLMKDECCATGPAVRYEGWSSTVHTFEFKNEVYADAFIVANEGKIIG